MSWPAEAAFIRCLGGCDRLGQRKSTVLNWIVSRAHMADAITMIPVGANLDTTMHSLIR
jgi:nitrate/nitrite transporter NarK